MQTTSSITADTSQTSTEIINRRELRQIANVLTDVYDQLHDQVDPADVFSAAGSSFDDCMKPFLRGEPDEVLQARRFRNRILAQVRFIGASGSFRVWIRLVEDAGQNLSVYAADSAMNVNPDVLISDDSRATSMESAKAKFEKLFQND